MYEKQAHGCGKCIRILCCKTQISIWNVLKFQMVHYKVIAKSEQRFSKQDRVCNLGPNLHLPIMFSTDLQTNNSLSSHHCLKFQWGHRIGRRANIPNVKSQSTQETSSWNFSKHVVCKHLL